MLEAGAVELLLTWYAESEGNVAATVASLAGSAVIEVFAWDADVNLSNTGREQANASGTVLARVGEGLRPEAVVSSRQARAQQTAEIAVQTAGWPLLVHTDERLRDRELGILGRLTRLGVETRFSEEAERRFELGKLYYRPPGGETWAEVALRLQIGSGGAQQPPRGAQSDAGLPRCGDHAGPLHPGGHGGARGSGAGCRYVDTQCLDHTLRASVPFRGMDRPSRSWPPFSAGRFPARGAKSCPA